jgi:hypothetical protein
MALGSQMLQLSVIQEIDEDVQIVAPFFAEVFEFLSLGTVTVREIALEKTGGVQGNNSAIPIDVSPTGFARLRLLFPSARDDEIFLLAPSHVPSPPIKGAGLAILEVNDSGYHSAETNLQVARWLGAHAYFDET